MSVAKNNTAIATTDTASNIPRSYVGRFAPSPTGLLHLGSLYTAVASYLDARAVQGRWIVRIEDLDRPREVDGAAQKILRVLEDFGFEWDAEVVRQSTRSHLYLEALRSLRDRHLSFDCSCTREDLGKHSRYPGTCRDRPHLVPTGVRLIVVPHTIHFLDRIQGSIYQDVAATSGDLLIRRRDQLISYLLAVVVDDADQGVTHVVRGADLIDETPRQIYLQQQLQLATPEYAHVPTLVEEGGLKLAKSRRSLSLCSSDIGMQLIEVFQMLGLKPPQSLHLGTIPEIWGWAVEHWQVALVPKRPTMRLLNPKINKYL